MITGQTFTDDAEQASEQTVTSCLGAGAVTSDSGGQLTCHMPLTGPVPGPPGLTGARSAGETR